MTMCEARPDALTVGKAQRNWLSVNKRSNRPPRAVGALEQKCEKLISNQIKQVFRLRLTVYFRSPERGTPDEVLELKREI